MKFNTFALLSIIFTMVSARPSNDCWSMKFNIPCCKETNTIERITYDGVWGKENGEWCSFGFESTRPADDVVQEHPGLTDLDTVDDPAADCDISDSITGDSLAKEAPFRFGVGLNGIDVANATTTSKVMRQVIQYQFNSMTYTNNMKPLFILDHEGSLANAVNGNEEEVAVDFKQIVDGLDFAQKNGIHMRGHVLVWHKQTPDWFFRVGFDESNDYADPETIFQRLDSFIRQYFGFLQHYYPGVVDAFDVVNEAVEVLEGKFDNSTGWYTRTESYEGDDNVWLTRVGPEYVVRAFRIARKYALPNVKLVYNDYDTFKTTPHDKTQAIIDLMHILQKEDLVDALGMESYIQPDSPTPEEYGRAIERFTAEGFELQLTEFTIYTTDDDDWLELQTKQYREFFEKVMEEYKNGANITSFTVFGIQDGYRFYETDSTKTRLFDHDLQKKPNYHAIMEVLKAYNAENNITDTTEVAEDLENETNEVAEDLENETNEVAEDLENDTNEVVADLEISDEEVEEVDVDIDNIELEDAEDSEFDETE